MKGAESADGEPPLVCVFHGAKGINKSTYVKYVTIATLLSLVILPIECQRTLFEAPCKAQVKANKPYEVLAMLNTNTDQHHH